MDSRNADPDDSVDVVFYHRTATGPSVFTELTRRTYGPELYRRDEVLTATNVTIEAGELIRVALEYASGVTPPSRS